jgi:hypothetical protein
MNQDIDFAAGESSFGHEFFRSRASSQRITWLKAQFPQNDLYLFQDGRISRLLFQEAIACFEDGHFAAALVLAASFVERSIAGRFFQIGRKDLAEGTSHELITAAAKQGWLTEAEASHLNNMRSLRNSIVHFREPLDLKRPEIRALLAAKDPTAQLENDARIAMSAAIHVLSKVAI